MKMKRNCFLSVAVALIVTVPVLFNACQEDAPEINYTLNVSVVNDFSAVVDAINDGALKNEAAIGKLVQAIDKMNADQAGKIEAVVNVLNALDNTLDAKLAALEAAMQAQTLSLEGKLDLIKAAIEALPDYSDKLDAVANALDAMAAQVDALGGSQDAVAGKIADVTEAIYDLIASVNSGNTDTAKALAAIVAMLEELKEAISSGGGGETPGDNSVVLDGETLTIVSAAIDQSDLEIDNYYDIYLFLSEDKTKYIEVMANGTLHDGKTLDLTKKEDEHDGWYWAVEMRTPQRLFVTYGKPGSDYPVFLSGTLLVKRIGTGTEFEVTLKDGKVKGSGMFGDGLEHTISLNYKGTLDFGEF